MRPDVAETYEMMGQRYCRACDAHVGEGSGWLLLRAVGFFAASWMLPYVLLGGVVGMLLCVATALLLNPLSLVAGFVLALCTRKVVAMMVRALRLPMREEWHFCEDLDRLLRLPRRWPLVLMGVALPVASALTCLAAMGFSLDAQSPDFSAGSVLGSTFFLGLSVLYLMKFRQLLSSD